MHFNMSWNIVIGAYTLCVLDSVEIHKSVDLLADTCTIKLPASVFNRALQIEDENGKNRIERGNKISVKFGYDSNLKTEFEGYLLSVDAEDGGIVLNCEDALFLLRVSVPDFQFKQTTVAAIATYCLQNSGVKMGLNCTLSINYDKFVINQATAYDVLKKLQEETHGNFYIKDNVLNIHPPYIQTHGHVAYNFQQNIEKSDLKYKRKDDKKVTVTVKYVGKDGRKKTVVVGEPGGDNENIKANGITETDVKKVAQNGLDKVWYDGYEGSITSWLIPYIENGWSGEISDDEYPYKNGTYYIVAVTTTFDQGGGVRKVQIGKKLSLIEDGLIRPLT